MTPKQRSKHIDALKILIKSFGYVEDRWGNYKATSGDKEYRLKIMANNLRAEVKSASGWANCFSKPLVKVEFLPLATWLASRKAN